jgi:hypothetical protein
MKIEVITNCRGWPCACTVKGNHKDCYYKRQYPSFLFEGHAFIPSLLSGKGSAFCRFSTMRTGQNKQAIISQSAMITHGALIARLWGWGRASFLFIAPPKRFLSLCHIVFDDGSRRFHTLKSLPFIFHDFLAESHPTHGIIHPIICSYVLTNLLIKLVAADDNRCR